MRNKKFWSILLCLSMLMTMLCFPANALADDEPANGVVRLYFWYDLTESDLESIAWVEDRYDIKVEWEIVAYEMLYPRMVTEVANGTGPDLIFLTNQRFPMVALKGLVRPIDELNQEIINNPLLLENAKMAREYYSFGGKSYAVRGNVEPRWIFFNETMFEDYGMETPLELYEAGEWTMDAFRQCAIDIMDYDEDGNVTTWGFGTWVYDMWFVTNGGAMAVETGDGGVKLTLDDPRTIWGYEFLQNGYFKDKFIKPNGNKNLDTDFVTGQTAMTAESIWRVKNFTNMKDEWDFVPVPVGPDNEEGILPGQCDAWGITTCSKNPEGALLYLLGMEEYAAEHPGDEADLYNFTEEQAARYRQYTTNEALAKVQGNLLEGLLADPNLLWSYWDQVINGMPIATINAIFEPVYQAELDVLLKKK